MTATIPTIEPQYAKAGDTWTWTKSLTDYSPDDGWALTYYLKGNGNSATITTTNSGGLFLATIAAATTAPFVAGTSYLDGYVSKGTERFNVYSGSITIAQNLATATGTYNGSSAAQTILSAIDAVLAQKATEDQKVLQHDNLRLEQMTWDELIKARNYWQNIVNQEKSAEAVRNGKSPKSLIKIGFR